MRTRIAPKTQRFARRVLVVGTACLMFLIAAGVRPGVLSSPLFDGPACPAQGSGAAGVAAFAAACDHCHNPALTCNGNFSIELVDVQTDAMGCITFTYDVCRLAGSPAGLSHFVLGLGQIDCLAQGFTIADLVKSCSINGVAAFCVVGVDPTTALGGVKIDVTPGTLTDVGTCIRFTFSLNTNVLTEGQTIGVGCVVGVTKAGPENITRTDRLSPGYACIRGPVCQEREQEGEGCTPGYWKQEQHFDSWPEGFSPNDLVGAVFNCAPFNDATLLDALNFGGGPSVDDAKKILLRAAVAAVLNAASPGVDYPRTVADIVAAVNTACASNDRDAILALKDQLDADNNLGCPLN